MMALEEAIMRLSGKILINEEAESKRVLLEERGSKKTIKELDEQTKDFRVLVEKVEKLAKQYGLLVRSSWSYGAVYVYDSNSPERLVSYPFRSSPRVWRVPYIQLRMQVETEFYVILAYAKKDGFSQYCFDVGNTISFGQTKMTLEELEIKFEEMFMQ